MNSVLIGVSDNNVAILDAALGIKVPIVRDYATLANPAPASWTALAVGRMLFASLKLKLGSIVRATDVTAGMYDAQIIAFVKFLISLGIEWAIFDHEVDAQTAAAGGTAPELNAAVLHCHKVARSVPGWNGRIAGGVTGYDETHRGPLFAPIFADADGIMVDQPYANAGIPSGDSIVGPTIDWFNTAYPGKPIVIGEWGSTAGPGRAAWITQFVSDLHTLPRYKSVFAALYWDATTGSYDAHVTGTADQAALVTAIKSSLDPTVALRAQIASLQAQVTTLTAQVTTLQGQLTTATAQAATATAAASKANAIVAAVARINAALTAALAA